MNMSLESQTQMPLSPLTTRAGVSIPLLGVRFDAELIGDHLRLSIVQRYRNDTKELVEAIYTFPTTSSGAVVGFSMDANGRTIEGVVEEKEAAFRAYVEAVSQGHGGALLEQERPNIFTANVGNLLPGEDVTITIKIVERVESNEGALRIKIPTLVAPRYIPGSSAGDRTAHGTVAPTDRVPDADRITPREGIVSYRAALRLRALLAPNTTATSPTHACRFRTSDGYTYVELDDAPLDRDIVVSFEPAARGSTSTLAIHRPASGPGYFAWTHVPDLGALELRGEGQKRICFVVDRSGSMEGASIEEARKALKLCLRQLRRGDSFQILAFDQSVKRFAMELVPFDQRTLSDADAFVDQIHAQGGTELLRPLEEAVDAVQCTEAGIVILLTDGQVGNEDEIRTKILSAVGKTRIYSFAIGFNASDALLRDLSQRTRASMEQIVPGEAIDEKVTATFARALTARVTDVKFTLESLSSEGLAAEVDDITPMLLPDLIDGEPFSVFARFAKAGSMRGTLRGSFRGTPYVSEMNISLPSAAEHSAQPAIALFWARERLRDLDAQYGMLAENPRRQALIKEQMIELAKSHGLSSRFTSFVVIERREGERRVMEPARAIAVPVSAPAGSMRAQSVGLLGGAVSAAPLRPAPRAYAPPAPAAATYGAIPPGGGGPPEKAKKGVGSALRERAESLSKRSVDVDDFDSESESSSRGEAFADAGPNETQADRVFKLLSSQQASGLFVAPPNSEVKATTEALIQLLGYGIDASHSQYGAQIKKAVEALLDLLNAALEVHALERALLCCFVISQGLRSKQKVRDAIDRLMPKLSGIVINEEDARRSLCDVKP